MLRSQFTFPFVFLLLVSFIHTDVLTLRKAYHAAIDDSEKAQRFHQEMVLIKNPDLVQTGYLGASKMLMAKFVFSPLSKFNYFTEGKIILEKAVTQDPNQVELRYLRYIIQLNCPEFLNYRGNIKQDKAFLLQQTPGLKDRDLRVKIITILNTSGSLTDAERKILQ